MRRFPTFMLSVLAVALTFGAGCAKHSSGDVQGYIEGEYVHLAAPLGGALTSLAVARGDTVKVGQLLFTLERESEAAVVQQAEKNLAQAEAALNRSGAEFVRREQLSVSGANIISAEELSRSQAQRDADAAQVASQKAALTKARWAYDQKQQVAPTDAQVHDTLYRQGEFVTAASPVVSLLPPENLKVRFFVPQEKLSLVKVGGTVSVQPDGAKQPFTATVNYISTQAEYTPPVIYSRETRANLVFMIEAKFSPADAAELRPGQPVDIKL